MNMSVVGRLMYLDRGEMGRVTTMFSLLGLIIGASYILKPVRSSLFLSEFGAERLPYVYILIALVLGLVAAAFSRVVARCRLNRLFVGTALFFAASLVVFWWAVDSGWRYIAFAFFVWVSIIMIVLPSLFWLLANYVFYSNEARRLFGTLTAGGILGSIVGGGVTSALVGTVGTAGLLLCAAAVLVLVALLAYRVERTEKDRLTERSADLARSERRTVSASGKNVFSLITGSRYLSLLSLLVGLTAVTSTLVDYQFNAVAEKAFFGRDALTGFFGTFFASVNILAFVLQIALASRLLTRLGVGAGLALLPSALLASSVSFFFFPLLATAALIKLSDDGLSNSINKSSVEILFLPIPLDVKNRTKAWLDMFVERASRGIGGLVILLAIQGLALGTSQLSVAVVALATPWLFLAFALRREYVKAFRNSLARRDIDVEGLTADAQDPQTRRILEQVLSGTDERQILYALELLRGSTDENLIEPVKDLTRHPSDDVKISALRMLASYPRPPSLPELTLLSESVDPVLSAEALGILARTRPREAAQPLATLLAAGDPRRIHALMDCMERFPGMLEGLIEEGFVLRRHRSPRPEERELAARALGFMPKNLDIHPLLAALLDDPVPQVARAGAVSAARLRQDWLVALLVSQLRRRPLRASARRALARFGDVAQEIVIRLLEDPSQDLHLRRALPRVLVEFPDQRTVQRLLACLPHSDLHFHHQLVKALGKLRARAAYLRFPAKDIDRVLSHDGRLYSDLAAKRAVVGIGSGNGARGLLVRALEERLDLVRENLFRTLGLVYPSQDLYNAWNGVVNGKPAVRAAALEFLGNVLQRNHRSRLLPLIEARSWNDVYRRGQELFGIRRATLEGALRDLTVGDDAWLAACAIFLATELKMASLDEHLARARIRPEPVVREVAEAFARGRASGEEREH